MWLRFSFCLLFASTLAADSLSHLHHEGESMYARAINDVTLDADLLDREKRQAPSSSERYHVTQCSYDNSQCCNDGASIDVLGVDLQFSDSTLKAAKLVHRMVRFMPRSLFVNLASRSNTSIGLFSSNDLPLDKFEEFTSVMPTECRTTCNQVYLRDTESFYDCSRWCTTSEYPINPNYHINFLWAYGNVSRMFVVETNVVCQGFNTGRDVENFLMREFGLMLMTRVFDEGILSAIDAAYEAASTNSHWGQLTNKYHYFMKATQIWFDGITKNTGDMTCLHLFDIYNNPVCEDLYAQRQHMKNVDKQMFDILNYVFNDNREYLNGETSLCDW